MPIISLDHIKKLPQSDEITAALRISGPNCPKGLYAIKGPLNGFLENKKQLEILLQPQLQITAKLLHMLQKGRQSQCPTPGERRLIAPLEIKNAISHAEALHKISNATVKILTDKVQFSNSACTLTLDYHCALGLDSKADFERQGILSIVVNKKASKFKVAFPRTFDPKLMGTLVNMVGRLQVNERELLIQKVAHKCGLRGKDPMRGGHFPPMEIDRAILETAAASSVEDLNQEAGLMLATQDKEKLTAKIKSHVKRIATLESELTQSQEKLKTTIKLHISQLENLPTELTQYKASSKPYSANEIYELQTKIYSQISDLTYTKAQLVQDQAALEDITSKFKL